MVGKYEGNNRVLASSVTTTPMKEMLGITPVYSLKDLIKPKNYAETVRKVLEANQEEIEDFIPDSLIEPVAEVLKWAKQIQDAKKEEEELDSVTLEDL